MNGMKSSTSFPSDREIFLLQAIFILSLWVKDSIQFIIFSHYSNRKQGIENQKKLNFQFNKRALIMVEQVRR